MHELIIKAESYKVKLPLKTANKKGLEKDTMKAGGYKMRLPIKTTNQKGLENYIMKAEN